MKIYLASRYGRRAQLRKHRQELRRLGHECTSRWLDSDEEESAAMAERDIQDVAACDTLILFCEAPRCGTRNGRMVECGVALGLNKTVLAIGADIENIFLLLPDITRYGTWTECLAALAPDGVGRHRRRPRAGDALARPLVRQKAQPVPN
jgi:nucleoside 2-deoxyribosyltransferase